MSRAIVTEECVTYEVLRSALGASGWRPYRGAYTRARELAAKGLLAESGVTVMPPHVLYIITDAGLKYMRMQEARWKRARNKKRGGE